MCWDGNSLSLSLQMFVTIQGLLTDDDLEEFAKQLNVDVDDDGWGDDDDEDDDMLDEDDEDNDDEEDEEDDEEEAKPKGKTAKRGWTKKNNNKQ